MRSLFLLMVIFGSFTVFAGDFEAKNLSIMGWNFVAPVTNTSASTPDNITGLILFDLNGNQFKGYNNSGTLVDLSMPNGVNAVGSSGSGESVERVTVSSTCSSSPCTVASQSGSWISSITRQSTGTYTANFVSGTWSNNPTCVVTSIGGQSAISSFPSISSFGFATYNTAGTLTDTGFSIICMGPN